jgi:16S rRNA (uracil1498-N3)-methyltransferase
MRAPAAGDGPARCAGRPRSQLPGEASEFRMRRRFFVDRFEANSAALEGDSADHLGRVLRAERGQLYELSDGRRVWLASIERIALAKHGRSRIEFALLEPLGTIASQFEIDLLVAIVKFDRLEWCLEKATELGATTIIPLATARSDKRLVGAARNRQERWKRILVESAQQARRLNAPALGEVSTPVRAFSQARQSVKIILSERRDVPSLARLVSSLPKGGTALAIGPEGGWTESEIGAARSAGFVEASLDDNILRTETAVLAGLAVVRFVLAR